MSAAPTPLGVLLPAFAGPVLPEWLGRRLDDGLAGICLFGSNVESPAQLRALTDAVVRRQPAAVIAIDEEGGDVTRLHAREGAPDPGNAWLGRYDDLGLTAATGRAIARELAATGCNLNLAPSADVNSDPRNPVIGVRSFGADPTLVARHTAAWVAAHEAEGVATCPKHFPGHGDTSMDSHLALPVVTASAEVLRERDLPPFAAAVAAGARTVMTSHLVVPALDPERPATFSPLILGDLLRDDLGFDGVVVSDALDMKGASGGTGIPEAAVRALLAGCDLLCLGSLTTEPELDAIVAAIEEALGSGRLPAARLAAASDRVARLGAGLAEDRRAAGAVGTDAEPVSDLASVFDVTPGAAGALARLRIAPGSWRVVQLETTANIAAGPTPWGPGAVAPVRHVTESGAEELVAGADPSPLVVVGRDLARHAWTRRTVDALRDRPDACLVVEMGTPDPDRRYADVVTYGASRALGAALLAWLGMTAAGSDEADLEPR